jgi:hypothetical protein
MLEQEFEQLAKTIRQAVTKYRESSSTVTVRQVRVRRRDFSLVYGPDPEFANFKRERIEEDFWDWRDQERFHGSVIDGLQEFKSLVAMLGPKSRWVEGFARSISFASFQGLDDGELLERVNAIGRELDGRPLPVKVTAYINGLSINESPLVISDGFSLRHPIPEDTAEYVMLDEYGGFSFPPLAQTLFSVVGELVLDAVNTAPAQMEFLRRVNALRLFRVGGIASYRYSIYSRHFPLMGGRVTNSGPGPLSRFAYTLSSSDAAALSNFLRDVVPLLPDPLRSDKITSERQIAYTRYTDAIFQEGPLERAITSAITALEALFLQEKTELGHRLAQRVSLFLRVLGTQSNAPSTFETIKRGYNIRSKFIHGGSLKAKERPEADSLAPVLMEYTRECVLACFQVLTPKDKLLDELDRAMIDTAGMNQLQASLAPIAHK